jgi:hypothetical protein
MPASLASTGADLVWGREEPQKRSSARSHSEALCRKETKISKINAVRTVKTEGIMPKIAIYTLIAEILTITQSQMKKERKF